MSVDVSLAFHGTLKLEGKERPYIGLEQGRRRCCLPVAKSKIDSSGQRRVIAKGEFDNNKGDTLR